MDKPTLQQFETQCIQEEPPACQTWCPLHLDARTFIRHLTLGRWDEARKIMDRHLPLSGLAGYLCEGPCREHCRRAELDQGIDLPLLERFCLIRTKAPRIMAMPAVNRTAAIFGSGLAALTLAWELGRKGWSVTIFHVGPPGGRLRDLPPERLPGAALVEALDQLTRLRVAFEPAPGFSRARLDEARAAFQAVFLSFDDQALSPAGLGLTPAEAAVDPVTLATGLERVFARPVTPEASGRFIDDLAAGRRAAGSLDRLAAGGSPASARDGEDVYPTRLYTNLDGAAVQPLIPPADPLAPTEDEAGREAGRCLDCQCLECVKVCPYLKHYQGYPKKYAREIYNNVSTAFGIRKSNTMILSCAECGLCREVCPHSADTGDFVAAARRHMTGGRHMPVSAHEFALEDLVFSNAPDISFYRPQPGRTDGEWLFFPGCQLPASRPGATAAIYDHLRTHLDGGVGFHLACCGAPARWSGRPGLTGEVVAAWRATWEAAGRPKVIPACASCARFFREELPEVPIVTLWATLADLPLPDQAGRLDSAPPALHDPCAARHDQATQKSVRLLLEKLRQPVRELPLGGHLTRCCGYGGLASAANPALGDQFALARAGDTADTLLAYCIMCRDRLAAVGRPALHLADLLFPRGTPPAEAALRPAPGISDRQESRAEFRRLILKNFWGEDSPEVTHMDLVIHIPDDLAPKLEARRILRSDIAKVLREAQTRGAAFVNPATSRQLASFRPRQVTFWVEYTPRPDGSFEIHDAYAHRMLVPGVPGPGEDSAASREGFDPKGGRV